MSAPRILLFALLFALAQARAGEALVLTFSQSPASTGTVYSTTTATSLPALSVMAGQQVTLSKSSGRDYQLQAAALARSPTQVQEIPRDTTTVSVMPLVDGDSVTMEVSYHERQGTESVSYSSTVSGKLGQWIALLQPNASSGADSKTYVAGDVRDQLSVKVDYAR